MCRGVKLYRVNFEQWKTGDLKEWLDSLTLLFSHPNSSRHSNSICPFQRRIVAYIPLWICGQHGYSQTHSYFSPSPEQASYLFPQSCCPSNAAILPPCLSPPKKNPQKIYHISYTSGSIFKKIWTKTIGYNIGPINKPAEWDFRLAFSLILSNTDTFFFWVIRVSNDPCQALASYLLRLSEMFN